MFNLKQASLADCKLINQLAQQVFPATYENILTPEQIEYMMEWMYSIKNLQKQMKEEGHIYFIAYEKDTPCGYLSIQQENNELFHLQKIYILPAYQGKKYGKKLFEKAIEYIKQINLSPCRMILNVNRNNKAIHFYEKLGMKKIGKGDFPIGNGFLMEDYIMAIDI